MDIKRYSFVTDQGPFLSKNEDAILIELSSRLFAVVDGFGLVEEEDTIAKWLSQTIKQKYSKLSADPEATFPFKYSARYLPEGNAIINAVWFSHQQLVKKNRELVIAERGGASLIAAAVSEKIITFVSVGNCQALLIREGKIKSLVTPALVELSTTENFHCPLAPMGLFNDLTFEVREHRIETGDKILLMTSGAYFSVTAQEILEFFSQKNTNFREQIIALFKLANGRGNNNNQTALLLQF